MTKEVNPMNKREQMSEEYKKRFPNEDLEKLHHATVAFLQTQEHNGPTRVAQSLLLIGCQLMEVYSPNVETARKSVMATVNIALEIDEDKRPEGRETEGEEK